MKDLKVHFTCLEVNWWFGLFPHLKYHLKYRKQTKPWYSGKGFCPTDTKGPFKLLFDKPWQQFPTTLIIIRFIKRMYTRNEYGIIGSIDPWYLSNGTEQKCRMLNVFPFSYATAILELFNELTKRRKYSLWKNELEYNLFKVSL